MAVYQSLGINDAHFVADADLTDWQYRFVTIASTVGNVKKGTGGSDPTPVGVLQNSPSAGQEARVTVLGFTKLVGRDDNTCNMKWGKFFTASDGGQAYVQNPACAVIGRWYDANITTANASAIGMAFVFCGGLGASGVSAS